MPAIPFADFPAPSLAEELRAYVQRGARPGGVLTALLCGDVRAALALGGPEVRAKVGEVAIWLDDQLPIGCYGGRAIVERWLDMHAHPEAIVPVPTFDAVPAAMAGRRAA